MQKGQKKGEKEMRKKLVAILLAASMVASSSMTVLAAKTDSNDAESVTAAADDAETEKSDSAEAGSDEKNVDFRELLDAYLLKIEEAVGNVDLKEKIDVTGREFSETGTLFTLLGDILTDINERRSEEGAEEDEAVSQALEALVSLEDADEDELDTLVATLLLGLAADDADGDLEEDPGEDLTEDNEPEFVDITNAVVTFIVETAQENELIEEAVNETGSKLFDTLSDLSSKLEAAVNEDGTLDLTDSEVEIPFDEFEEELPDVMDYINNQDGPKQAALDVLELLHGIVDELHFTIDGHSHEGAAAETE